MKVQMDEIINANDHKKKGMQQSESSEEERQKKQILHESIITADSD